VNQLTSPPHRPASWLAAIALVLAGAVVGAFAGRWSASSGATGRDSIAVTRDSASDTAGLEDLRHSIDDLSRALRERPTQLAAPTIHSNSVPPDRQPALPDLTAFDRLGSAVERLDELLRAGPSHSGSTLAAPKPSFGAKSGPGYPSLASMRTVIDTIRSAHPDDIDSYANREFSRAHVLWTREDVIERYGLPMKTDANGDQGLNLIYEGFDTTEERCYFLFQTRIEPGSLVTDVGFFCGSKDDH
jgi:hypothetical protein